MINDRVMYLKIINNWWKKEIWNLWHTEQLLMKVFENLHKMENDIKYQRLTDKRNIDTKRGVHLSDSNANICKQR